MSQAMTTAPARNLPKLIVLAASVGCLAAAYGAAGQWAAAGLLLVPGLLLAFHGSPRAAWVPPVFLCGMISAAAAGALVGAPAFLLILGAALALAAWDLACFDRFLRRSGSLHAVNDLQKNHARSLVLAVGLGLGCAGGGLALSLRIPFAVMLLLVVADLVCLGLVFLSFSRRRPRT